MKKLLKAILLGLAGLAIALTSVVTILVFLFGGWIAFNEFDRTRFPSSDQSYANVVWSKGISRGSIQGMVASRDHVYISGMIETGGQHLEYDAYIAKLDAKSGRLIFFTRHEEKKYIWNPEFTKIALAPESNLPHLFIGIAEDLAIQKYSTEGKIVWSEKIRSYDSDQSPRELPRELEQTRVGPNGNVFMVEIIGGRPRYGVQKRNVNGKLVWQHEVDYKYFDFKDLDFDKEGSVYFNGRVKESENTDAAIFSYDTKGKPRPNIVIEDAAEGSNIGFAVDKQESAINVIIKTPGEQQDVWQRYSTSGKMLNSRQLDFKVDVMIGGSTGKVYFFTDGKQQVTLRGYTRSGKSLFKEKYSRTLFNTHVDLGQSIAISADPDAERRDAIYVFADGASFIPEAPNVKRIISRLRVP